MGKIFKKKKNAKNVCVVPDCTNDYSSNISFHDFPVVNKEIRDQWKSFCGINCTDYICKRYRVCSDHFAPDCFDTEHLDVKERTLKNEAVPTIMNLRQFEVIKVEAIPQIFETTLKKCRICLKIGDNMHEIFDEKEPTPNKGDKISQCAHIEISKNDGFPQNICNDCVSLLDNAYTFKLLCEQSNQTLRFGAKHITPEVVKSEIDISSNDDCEIQAGVSQFASSKLETHEVIKSILIEDEENIWNDNESFHCDVKNDLDSSENDIVSDDQGDNNWIGKIALAKYKKKANTIRTIKQSPESELRVKEKKKRIRTKKYIPKKNYQCDECGLCVLGPTALEDHKLHHHQGILSYKCSECPKSYSTNNRLKAHIKYIHETKAPLVCDICGKPQKHIALLKAHKKRHVEEKNFQCEYCPYKSFTRTGIKNHQSMHTGERHFECDTCGKIFRLNNMLQNHIKRIHYNIRPFKCDQCEKSFYSNTKLRKHSVVHTGLKPFACPQCPNVAYSWYVALTAHQKSSHPDLKLETEGVMYKKFILETDKLNLK